MVSQIRELCEKNNTSIKALEKTLGLGNGTIRRWDKQSPSIDKVILVAEYFGVSVSFLMSGKPDERNTAPEPGSGITEKDIRVLNWFNSLPPETRKAILTLGGGPEDLGE